MRRAVNNFAKKSGYGAGFWTLLVGLLVAATIIVQLERSEVHFSPKPLVERIPASDIYLK